MHYRVKFANRYVCDSLSSFRKKSVTQGKLFDLSLQTLRECQFESSEKYLQSFKWNAALNVGIASKAVCWNIVSGRFKHVIFRIWISFTKNPLARFKLAVWNIWPKTMTKQIYLNANGKFRIGPLDLKFPQFNKLKG